MSSGLGSVFSLQLPSEGVLPNFFESERWTGYTTRDDPQPKAGLMRFTKWLINTPSKLTWKRSASNRQGLLTQQKRAFLLSFKSCTPDWSLLGLTGIDRSPAVRWKMQNLARMISEKHTAAYRHPEDMETPVYKGPDISLYRVTACCNLSQAIDTTKTTVLNH